MLIMTKMMIMMTMTTTTMTKILASSNRHSKNHHHHRRRRRGSCVYRIANGELRKEEEREREPACFVEGAFVTLGLPFSSSERR